MGLDGVRDHTGLVTFDLMDLCHLEFWSSLILLRVRDITTMDEKAILCHPVCLHWASEIILEM